MIAEGIAEYLDENDPILRDAPRDEHGHLRLAEIPIARVLRDGRRRVARGAAASR